MCIVSPELHQKEYKNLWKMLQQSGLHRNNILILYAEFSEEARSFYEE